MAAGVQKGDPGVGDVVSNIMKQIDPRGVAMPPRGFVRFVRIILIHV